MLMALAACGSGGGGDSGAVVQHDPPPDVGPVVASMIVDSTGGTVAVTDQDVTIDADLGFLGKLMPEEKVRTTVESRVRSLLT